MTNGGVRHSVMGRSVVSRHALDFSATVDPPVSVSLPVLGWGRLTWTRGVRTTAPLVTVRPLIVSVKVCTFGNSYQKCLNESSQLRSNKYT